MYNMNMSEEKKPLRKKLLPTGWRHFKFIKLREAKSKSQNSMIIFTIQDIETGYEEELYAVSEPKKRWFLKEILNAVGCQGGEDGNYSWSKEDVIGEEILGLVEHEPNDWIDRNGNKHEDKKHKIVEVKESTREE